MEQLNFRGCQRKLYYVRQALGREIAADATGFVKHSFRVAENGLARTTARRFTEFLSLDGSKTNASRPSQESALVDLLGVAIEAADDMASLGGPCVCHDLSPRQGSPRGRADGN